MTRFRKIGALAFISMFLLTACGAEKPEPIVSVPIHKPPVIEPVEQTEDLSPVVEQTEEKITIAVLLPLSGQEAGTGKALLRAITMALFDAYDPRLTLLPLDTKANASDAEVAANAAVGAGASVVLGPLLAGNVQAAGAVLQQHNIPLIGFSNDSSVAAPGQYIMGFMPESEIKRVVDFASSQGLKKHAALVPEGRYGQKVKVAFGEAVTAAGGSIMAIETYAPDPNALFEPVKRLASYDKRRKDRADEIRFLKSLRDDLTDEIAESIESVEVMEGVPFEAVFLPEGGSLLRALAPLLPFYEIDPNSVQLLGTGLWNNPELLREPQLQNALFAAPQPEGPTAFLKRFQKTYDEEAPRIATLAYDAMSLLSMLAREEPNVAENGSISSRFSAEALTSEAGFMGTDGLFRFLPDGSIERMLAVLQVHRRGFKVADAAPKAFPAFGFALTQRESPLNN